MKYVSKAIAAAVLLGVMGSATAGVELSVELRALPKGQSDGTTVLWQLMNHTGKDVYVVRQETPMDGLSGALFEVSHKGNEVSYVDAMVHWAEPTSKDLIRIGPHEAISAVVDLSSSYRMDGSGEYSVRFRGHLSDVLSGRSKTATGDDYRNFDVQTQTVALQATGRAADYYDKLGAPHDAGAFAGGSRSVYYSASCSANQRTLAWDGHTRAQTYTWAAISSLAGIGARYTTWFGAYVYSRYSKVWTTFNNISWALNSASINYDCYCAPAYQGAFAYVYPAQPYNIHLCPYYWAAPRSGTDSKGGTIVHELSHFTVLGGTLDYSYGHADAKSLASNSPGYAIWNADNYEYFAENTPFQY